MYIRDALPTPRSPQDERHLVARLELGQVVLELADAQLGPRQVLEDRHLAPARPAASRTRRAVSACVSASPWEKFRRATSIPASTMRTSTSGSREAGADRGDDLRAAHRPGNLALAGAVRSS
jgi:hypothetical protein